MKIYDSLIIGCGYTALGYATAVKNSVIIEERQICDGAFYLPLPCFRHGTVAPTTAEGRAIYEYYSSRGLFGEVMQNLNGFESAFCGYALDNDVEILLKSRVVEVSEPCDSVYTVRVISPSGIVRILTKKVIDMRRSQNADTLTFLFTVTDAGTALASVRCAFPGAEIEKAYFPDRYAMHVKLSGDLNTTKRAVYEGWNRVCSSARLVYTAPTAYARREFCGGIPSDDCFKDPIEAFEAGLAYAKGEGRV